MNGKFENYTLLTDGKDYQKQFIELIRSAKSRIVLQTYIFEVDQFGEKVVSALKDMADTGVMVQILIDFFGSFDFNKEVLRLFENHPQIDFRFFNPIKGLKTLQMGRRLHHKVLIIDGIKMIAGGINVIDGDDQNFPENPRLDFALYIEDQSVSSVENYCSDVYYNRAGSELTKIDCTEKIKYLVNDWYSERKQITASYHDLISSSEKSILLLHGYFFPPAKIIRLLKQKRREGVVIRILFPRYSDWTSWVWATSHLYRDLIENGIIVMDWPHSNLHGKLAIFDEKILTMGSHNLNYTSSYGNLELNVELSDKEFVTEVLKKIEVNYLENSNIINNDTFLHRYGYWERFRNTVYYYILSMVSLLSVNMIKFGRNLLGMHPFWMLVILLLFLIGLIGVLLPILPGIPFFVVAMLIYSAKKKIT